MSRYIDAFKLKKKLHEIRQRSITIDRMLKIIDEQPTTERQEIRCGKWEKADTERGTYIRCSECHFDGLGAGSSFCPHCGAKMFKE